MADRVDVFISYKTESSLELVKDTIVPSIEAAGFRCWYAKRDSRHGLYAGNITRAIKACRVFLLVLNQDALNDANITSETNLAFHRLVSGERITLLPFRVDACDLWDDDNLVYYLSSQQTVNGCPPDAGHIQDLVSVIRGIMNSIS